MDLGHKVLEMRLAQYSSVLWTVTARAEEKDSDRKGIIARHCEQRNRKMKVDLKEPGMFSSNDPERFDNRIINSKEGFLALVAKLKGQALHLLGVHI